MSRASIYARQSLDRHGEGAAVSRQLELCRRFCAERGWEVAAEFVDNDRSATTGVERPEYARLLASSPERVVVWHIDRLVRLTRDLEAVIDLGVDVHAVTAGHLDLSTPAGRAVARTVTAWAAYEIEQKSERHRAANDQRAAAGLPFTGGRRLFGYEKDGMTVVEEEAAATRRMVEMFFEGASSGAVARWLQSEGISTSTGRDWDPQGVRQYILNPRLAGLRVHRGEVIGEGKWPRIITPEDQAALVPIVKDPARKRNGRPLAHLLSGIGRCGVCGLRLYGRHERRGNIYTCETGKHLGRRTILVDAYVEELAIGRLSMPDAAEAMLRPDQSHRRSELQAEQRRLIDRLDEAAEAFASGHITMRQLQAATTSLRARLDKVESEMPMPSIPGLNELLSADDIAEEWAGWPTEEKRRAIDALMTVTVYPVGRGVRKFDPSTVECKWKGA